MNEKINGIQNAILMAWERAGGEYAVAAKIVREEMEIEA